MPDHPAPVDPELPDLDASAQAANVSGGFLSVDADRQVLKGCAHGCPACPHPATLLAPDGTLLVRR